MAESPTLIEAYQQDVKQIAEGRFTDKWVDFHGVVGDAGAATLGMVAHPKDCGYDIAAVRDWALAAAAAREAAEQ